MANKLFFICCDCCIERRLVKIYGDDIFFTTALGAVFNFDDNNYRQAIIDLITRESIEEFYIVNDVSCRLINTVISKKGQPEVNCEKILNKLLQTQYDSDKQNKSILQQQIDFCNNNIKREFAEMMLHKPLADILANKKNICKGIILSGSGYSTIHLSIDYK